MASTDFKLLHASAVVIELRTFEYSNANREIAAEIERMWELEEKGNGDYVRWVDSKYNPDRHVRRFPALAQYIADHGLTGEILIRNSW